MTSNKTSCPLEEAPSRAVLDSACMPLSINVVFVSLFLFANRMAIKKTVDYLVNEM